MFTLGSRYVPASFRTRGTLLALSLLGALSTAVLATAKLIASPDAADHALPHLFAGLPAAIAAFVLARSWTPQAHIGRVGMITLVLALWIFAFGQFVESVGAFGWVDERERYRTLTLLHDVGVFGTPLGFFTALLAAPWCISAAIVRAAASRRALIHRISLPVNLALNIAVVFLVAFLAATGQ